MSARMIANARQRPFFDFYCPDRKDKQPLIGLGTHGAPRPAAIPARWPLSGSPQPSAACCTHLRPISFVADSSFTNVKD